MTDKEMEKEIARRTGLPRNAVRLFLDTQNDVIKEALIRQEDVAFKSLLRIKSAFKTRKTRNPKTKEVSVVRMLILGIKPMRVFRKELNQWTSTQ
jgi:nucleoid DNA-binding protein